MLDLTWPLTRPILFTMDAEVAHERTMALLEAFPRVLGAVARLTMGPPAPELEKVRRHGLAETAGSDFHQPVFKDTLGKLKSDVSFIAESWAPFGTTDKKAVTGVGEPW